MQDCAAIADALCERGWFCGAQLLDATLTHALLAEVQQLQHSGYMARAGVGRDRDHVLDDGTRRDCIHWLDGSTAAQQQYLAAMEQLRVALNRELMLGLFEFETHFAFYEPGAFYKKHLDSFAGRASRIVSVVSYLNCDWPADAGGELVVYNEHDREAIRVLPQAGTVAIFLSEKIPHEVLPASRERYSIAGWFRVNASGSARVDVMR